MNSSLPFGFKHVLFRHALLAFGLTLIVSCGGGGDPTPPADTGGQANPDSATQITSATGGAVLDIPAGAVSSSTQITLTQIADTTTLPETDGLISQVFSVAADGQLSGPLTLSLSLTETVGEGQLAFIAKLDGDTWQLLRQSVENGNVVSSTISEYATYAVIERNGLKLSANQAASYEVDDVTFEVPTGAFTQDTRITLDITEQEDDSESRSSDDEYTTTIALWASNQLSIPAHLILEFDDGVPLGRRVSVSNLAGGDELVVIEDDDDTVSVVINGVNTLAPDSLGVKLVNTGVAPIVTEIGPACDPNLTEQTISFVHVADLHSNYHRTNRYGKIREYYFQAKANNPYTIFSNGGDDYEKGSMAEAESAGLATLEIAKAMKFDVRVIGNHDFAWGVEQLKDYANDPHAKVILSNVEYEGDDFNALRYTQFQLGCVSVGVFGMVGRPWNELDEQFDGNYLESFIMDFEVTQLAELIVAQYGDDVDMMVMLSHLGVGADNDITSTVEGIDLVLGGHTHGGASIGTENGAIVIQPDFYGDGVTFLEFTWDIVNQQLSGFNYIEQPTAELTAFDEEIETKISEVLAQYAPKANEIIGTVENEVSRERMPQVAARAGVYAHQADAALLNPALVSFAAKWEVGDLTRQQMHDAYQVERQEANTPGVNSMYWTTISGAQLKQMIAAQPTWQYEGPSAIVDTDQYKVVLNKAAALNPALFFGEGFTLASVEFGSESYWALAEYVVNQTTSCKFADSQTPLPTCQLEQLRSVWNFNDLSAPLVSDNGPAMLSYRDVSNTGWGPANTQFGTTTSLGLPDLPDGPANVMGFAKTAGDQGYTVTHNMPPNGDYADKGKVSDYTIVLDLLWPAASDAKWRSMLQTNPDNSDDGDWFTNNEPSGGIGVIGYVGSLPPDTWHRIALVMYAGEGLAGEFKIYINGQLMGAGPNTDERWALDTIFHLFTDNRDETEAGFVSGIMFTGFAMTDTQVMSLGGPSRVLGFE